MKLKITILCIMGAIIFVCSMWSYSYGYKIGSYVGNDLCDIVEKSNLNHIK